MLQVQQAGHQANGKAWAAGSGNTGTGHLHRVAEQIVLRHRATCAHLASEMRRQHRLDLRPGQPTGQHRQRVARIDHLGQGLPEEVGVLGVGHR
ncbi:hypothetical protein BO993_17235 [Xanthomonas oryzae pv. oryzae]|nr:hypothetical protein BO993_17235 [Xanthomonas oryzae pv. oryzae]